MEVRERSTPERVRDDVERGRLVVARDDDERDVEREVLARDAVAPARPDDLLDDERVLLEDERVRLDDERPDGVERLGRRFTACLRRST